MQLSDHQQRIVRFFRSKYILWATGLLDQKTERQLNDLTPPGRENWRQVTERTLGLDAATILKLHTTLRETYAMSAADAAMHIVDSLADMDIAKASEAASESGHGGRNEMPRPAEAHGC